MILNSWQSPIGPTTSARASACSRKAPLHSPTPNCWRSSCASASRARARLIWRVPCSPTSTTASPAWRPPRRGTRTRAWHRPGQGGAARRHARTGPPRPARGTAQPRPALASPGAVRDWLRLALAHPAARSLRRPLAGCPEPPDRRRGTVSRHADADQRLSARSRQAGPGPQCRRRDPGAQPPAAASPSLRAPTKYSRSSSSRRWRWSMSASSIISSSPARPGRFPSPNAA